MRTTFGAVFAALLILPATGGLAAGKAPSVQVQAIAPPHGVSVSLGQVYARLDGFRPLTLDVYQIPSGQKEPPRPAILFVHGGLWMTGDAGHAQGFDDFPALLAELAGKGYVVASANYRLAKEAHFPAAVQDVKSALRWLRDHAADYNIDTTRVMVWGMEAGGQIAALVGASCGVSTLEPASSGKANTSPVSDCVEGVIDWAGPSDLTSWDSNAGQKPADGTATRLGLYLGCEPQDCAPGVAHAASPLSYLDNMTPPFLIQQGAADKLVPADQSRKLYDALQALHVPSTLMVYPDAGESFTVNGAADPATQKKVIADMEDFIAKTFPPAPVAAKAEKKSVKTRTKRG